MHEPRKSEQATLLVNTLTEKSAFQQDYLPGVLLMSEAPDGEGRSSRGTDEVRSPRWQG